MVNPYFFVLSGGGPTVTDSQGIPWQGTYVNANGDLTVDLRSDIAAESRAKIVYEYLMQFTDDPLVKETLRFLMTREVAHFQMFEAALESIQPNFPPGILQSDPKFSNVYFNMSDGEDHNGPWNTGKSTQLKERYMIVDDPITYVNNSDGLLEHSAQGTERTEESVKKTNQDLSEKRKTEIDLANATESDGILQWSNYEESADRKGRK
jgi:Mn-containing catalase